MRADVELAGLEHARRSARAIGSASANSSAACGRPRRRSPTIRLAEARGAACRGPCGRRSQDLDRPCPRASSSADPSRGRRATIELLKPPHRPRSAVATTTRWTCVLAGAGEQRRRAVGAPRRCREVGQHRRHPLGDRGAPPRPAPGRACSLRRRHHLHGAGDLLRRLDAADPDAQVLEAGHRLISAGGHRAQVRRSGPKRLGEACRGQSA